jgi:peroxiredoxin
MKRSKPVEYAGLSILKRNRVHVLSGLVALVLGTLFLVSISRPLKAQAVGREASLPSKTTTNSLASGIQGDAFNFDVTSYAGQVVVVNFMAGWCISCWSEIPEFVEVYESHKADGLVMFGISLQTPQEQTLAMIKQMDISYPVFQDEEGKVALFSFDLRAMPTTFIYDRNGDLVQRLEGKVSGSTLRQIIEGLL